MAQEQHSNGLVMVIDDNYPTRMAVVEILALIEIEVVEAGSGEIGIDIFSTIAYKYRISFT